MFKLASSLMAASALHVAVLAGTGWWHGGDASQGQGHHRRDQTTESPAHAGGWQWRLVTAHDSLSPATAATERPQAPPTQTGPDASAQTESRAATSAAQKDEYLPRGLLTKPPQALGMIDIPFPPGVPTPGRYKAVLALYIDENGVVRRIKTEGEALPAAYEEAARVSFQTASFQPGELQGRAVKSLIHVEVVFDDSQVSRGMSSSALGQSVAQR